ncbi:MAG TPA: CPBP family intramembrane glutamic endopeptidase [Thermoanaerobaculia bacterium]|nr:CPBP family intramembrane glutamic endopeptidase [Thermoanaerobaculia bacterium]
MFVLVWLRFPLQYWIGLVAVTVATLGTVAIWEGGRWPLGLFVPLRVLVPELGRGLLWGAVLVGSCAALVVLSTDVRHEPGRGFPWLELLTVFVPAALHEELLFRGYPFQKLLRWNRIVALLLLALVFAALHSGNTAVNVLGLVNIFLGGILLGLAYERYARLWFPFGIHLAWNLMTGPILGHEVSGYFGESTLFVERGAGPLWLTGGEFGIEGSIWMTLVEIIAISTIVRISWRRPMLSATPEKESNP